MAKSNISRRYDAKPWMVWLMRLLCGPIFALGLFGLGVSLLVLVRSVMNGGAWDMGFWFGVSLFAAFALLLVLAGYEGMGKHQAENLRAMVAVSWILLVIKLMGSVDHPVPMGTFGERIPWALVIPLLGMLGYRLSFALLLRLGFVPRPLVPVGSQERTSQSELR